MGLLKMASMQSFSAFLPVVFLLLCHLSFVFSEGLKCYNCGYLEDADGNQRPIVEGQEGSIPFCNGTNAEEWPSKEYPPGDCCASYKGYITGDEQMKETIVRHGAASDGDEFSFNYTCSEVEPGYKCRQEVLHFNDGLLEDAMVCHCYEELCNALVPDIEETTTTTGSSTKTVTTGSPTTTQNKGS